MTTLILRRLLLVVPTLLVVSFGVMVFSLFMKPDPAISRAGADPTKATIEETRERLGLNRPVLVRWADWVGDAAHFQFGTSFDPPNNPVKPEILRRLPVSLSIGLIALVMGTAIGIPVGILGGSRPGRLADRVGMGGTVLGISVPNFVICMALALLLGLRLNLLPVQWETVPFSVSPWGWFRQRIIPSSALAFAVAAAVARQLRGAVIDTLGSNYVRTAWSLGARRGGVIGKHALKNASIPAVTAIGLQLGAVIASTVLVESTLSVPGLGLYLAKAIRDQDVPVILGVTTFYVFIQLTISLLLDISYGLLNPKVRVS